MFSRKRRRKSFFGKACVPLRPTDSFVITRKIIRLLTTSQRCDCAFITSCCVAYHVLFSMKMQQFLDSKSNCSSFHHPIAIAFTRSFVRCSVHNNTYHHFVDIVFHVHKHNKIRSTTIHNRFRKAKCWMEINCKTQSMYSRKQRKSNTRVCIRSKVTCCN